ncbi:glycosidase [bacterium]|nr:MAG: glycosidase [bacterium]
MSYSRHGLSSPPSSVQVRRLGVVMEPDPSSALEVEGVCNPGVARGIDGELYLFPRLVARDNYSRIGIARVRFNADGDPIGVERLGIALEPSAPYERAGPGQGGCEDPRVSYLAPLGRYVMSYTALGSESPRIALATSDDLFRWERLGLVWFEDPALGVDFNAVNDKDAVFFPQATVDAHGRPALALVHRPLFPRSMPGDAATAPVPRTLDLDRESMWLSYCSLKAATCNRHLLCHFTTHCRLASPVSPWERLKIGAGTPPVATEHGYVMLYHGVAGDVVDDVRTMTYAGGLMVLDKKDPRVIRYRSPEPVLEPQQPEELKGTVDRVVFPTGADLRTDLGLRHRLDVYYGMADQRIGAACIDLPRSFPVGAPADRSDHCI